MQVTIIQKDRFFSTTHTPDSGIAQDSKGNSLNTYEVHIITTDNKEIKLVSGLGKKEQAWFIENNIEKYLGIEDVTVRGEVEE